MEEVGHDGLGYSNLRARGQNLSKDLAGDLWDVTTVFSKGWCNDLEHIDSVIEIRSELPTKYRRF
jgi:hypothetical protein